MLNVWMLGLKHKDKDPSLTMQKIIYDVFSECFDCESTQATIHFGQDNISVTEKLR